MADAERRTQLLRELMLVSSDVAQLSEHIAKLAPLSQDGDDRIDRLCKTWIAANLRAKALREELDRLDRQQMPSRKETQ